MSHISLLLWVSSLLVSFGLFAGVENSIVPLVEKFEKIEALPVKKYATNQLFEIEEALRHKEGSFRLVSYNMLFNLKDAQIDPNYTWAARLDRILELLDEMKPDLISAQELVWQQLVELSERLGRCYDYFGQKSDDKTINAIFYRKDRFELLSAKAKQMTPPSDALLSNALNIVKLKERKTYKYFALLNTHACFRDVNIREAQMHYIAKKAKKLSKRMPVLVTGDFNSFPNRLDLSSLPFYDGDHIERILTSEVLEDARSRSVLGHLGPLATFTNAADALQPFKGSGTPGVFLDHIYVTSDVEVLIHAVQAATVNGFYASDHMPVMIDFYVN